MKVRILGCGTSTGVPRIGNDWGVCDPEEPRNRRRRASILVEAHGIGKAVEEGKGPPFRILVDTGPDLRIQLLDADVADLDAVIWTHDHADHTHGIDELRQIWFRRRTPIPAYARPFALKGLAERFAYAFRGRTGYPATVEARDLPDTIDLGPLTVHVVDQPHGGITSAGLIFEQNDRKLAYSTDFHDMTDEMAAAFAKVDLWIVDAFGRREHPSHSHLAQTLLYIEQVGARRAILTHMDGSMDYRTLCAELPAHIEPGYDGMEVEL